MTNYNTRRSNNNKVLKSFKDYLFPIIIVGVIFLFVLNYLFSSNETAIPSNTNATMDVTLWVPDTESYVVFSGWNKAKIEGNVKVNQSEKLQVVNGNLIMKEGENEFSLNKLWEFRYNEDGGYTLYSSDLWVKSSSGINIEMRYAKIAARNEAVFSLSQNEVASTIYVVSGVVDIQNLAGKSASLQKGEKLVIMRNNANDEASDLSLSKEEIDDYIKSDDWFIKNNGSFYLSATDASSASGSITATGETLSGSLSSNLSSSEYITFSNLYDEAEIASSSLDIEGTVLSDMVFKIDINGKTAAIDNTAKTFSLKGFKLESRSNDLVYRVYDEGNKLLGKWVLTVYSTNLSNTSSSNTTTSTLAQVQNYPITSSPLYQIITPKQNPFTTSDNIVRIEGTVPVGTVEKIIVNDFELQKFPKFGSYWSYFANSEFGNLKEWINIYKIQYYGTEWKLIYENNFTIIKEVKKVEPIAIPTTPDVIVPEMSESTSWVTQ